MDFENVVGKDGSLHYVIQQIKSAIDIPRRITHIVSWGKWNREKYIDQNTSSSTECDQWRSDGW